VKEIFIIGALADIFSGFFLPKKWLPGTDETTTKNIDASVV